MSLLSIHALSPLVMKTRTTVLDARLQPVTVVLSFEDRVAAGADQLHLLHIPQLHRSICPLHLTQGLAGLVIEVQGGADLGWLAVRLNAGWVKNSLI